MLPMTAYLSSGPATCSLKLEDPHTLLTAMAPPRRTAFQLARHPLVRKPCERCCERYVVHRAESGHEQVLAPHNHSAPATYPSTKPGGIQIRPRALPRRQRLPQMGPFVAALAQRPEAIRDLVDH